jgi:O-antigen ligase
MFLLAVAMPIAFFPLSEAAFVDVKLTILTLGTLLVWLSGLPVDRHLGGPALTLALAFVAAAVFGVDTAQSLVGTIAPTGLITLSCCVALVAIAPAIPNAVLARARVWSVRTALALAGIAVVEQLAPAVLDAFAEDESFIGSTLGNPVILAGFLAAAIPMAVGGEGSSRRVVAIVAALGVGFAVVGERSAYLLPLVALVATWFFVRPPMRRLAVAGAALVVTFVLWTSIAASIGADGGSSRVAGQFSTTAAERQRLAVWTAQVRAVADRPLVGWGPANEWNSYVASATSEEMAVAGRYWGDAHNLVIGIGVVAGAAGLLAFGWLLWRLVPRLVRAPRPRAFAAASAATLGVYLMYEPLDVTLLPMAFLFAGAAVGPSSIASTRPRRGAVRAGVAGVLVAATAIATIGLASSSLEQWGRRHAGSRWAFERAWAIAPWRISAAEALAIDLALDGRAGDAAAAARAREVVDRLVVGHPTSPGVRLLAADVELLLRNFEGTRHWIAEHLRWFPNDDVQVPEDEPGVSIDLSNG